MTIIAIFVFLFGISIGSFLNVCIWRIPRGESIVTPSSRCPNCGHSIKWFENIPLLSWLVLRGRCSGCGESISPRYFCVELLTGLLFLIAWFRIMELRPPVEFIFPAFILYAVAMRFIVTTAFIDYDHRLIPDKTTYPVMFFGFLWAAMYPPFWGAASSFRALSYSCASATCFGVALSIFALAGRKIMKQDAFGWGDVKYVVAVAALLGPHAAFLTLFAGSVVGAVFGIALAVFKKKRNLKFSIPLGPCLAAGTFLWIVRGPELVAAFFRLTAAWRR
jgi:leader peptidase (prepilin peptidase)/N-methyltransferase